LRKRRPGNGAAFFCILALALAVVTLFAFLLFLVVVLGATLAFKILVARHIRNDVARIIAVGLFLIVALVGGVLGGLSLAFDAIFSSPTTSHPIDGTYYFTQQQYGFVTMMSGGYNLTFYRQRPFWPDQELGKIQLECTGSEAIRATLMPTHAKSFRLRIAADNQERLDTMLASGAPFNFRRTFEDKTIDFAKRP
jgi:hypothetical protein